MNTQTFQQFKGRLLERVDLLRVSIDQVSFDQYCKICEKYKSEDDPEQVALYYLFYPQISNTLEINTLL